MAPWNRKTCTSKQISVLEFKNSFKGRIIIGIANMHKSIGDKTGIPDGCVINWLGDAVYILIIII